MLRGLGRPLTFRPASDCFLLVLREDERETSREDSLVTRWGADVNNHKALEPLGSWDLFVRGGKKILKWSATMVLLKTSYSPLPFVCLKHTSLVIAVIVAWPPRRRHWWLILTNNNSVAILTAGRITEHNGAYPKIMLIQGKQQEAAVDSAELGSHTNPWTCFTQWQLQPIMHSQDSHYSSRLARTAINLVY